MEALKVEDLKVMQVVMGDEDIFDYRVSYTYPDGKVEAIRPRLVAWVDVKSRRILGDVICEHFDMDVRKQSFNKLLYKDAGSVPQYIFNDNKCYTADFYKSFGIENLSTMIQPSTSTCTRGYVERFFRTVCYRFTKYLDSDPDICKKVKQGKLLTMEEFNEKWNKWLHEVYEVKENEVLKRNGEEFTNPKSCFENADRYFKECPLMS